VLVGGRSKDDLFTVYLFHDPDAMQRMVRPGDLAGWRRERGAWPKGLRVARHLDGVWQHVDTQLVHFPDDAGFVRLELAVDGSTLELAVDGRRAETVTLPRACDGRIGLAKYYDTAAQWRGWRVGSR
jgi:hypothetical protein